MFQVGKGTPQARSRPRGRKRFQARAIAKRSRRDSRPTAFYKLISRS